MGNNLCGAECGPKIRTMEEELDMYRSRHEGVEVSLDKLRDMTKYYIQSRNVKPEDMFLVDQFISLNQVHIIEALRRATGKDKQKLVANLKNVPFQHIDSLYFSTIANKDIQHSYRPFMGNIKSKLKLNLQQYTLTGYDLLLRGKVAVIACLECFGPKNPPEKQLMCIRQSHLPSKKSSLKLILERIHYLTREHNAQIPIILVVDQAFEKEVKEWLAIHSPIKDIIIKIYQLTIPLMSKDGLLLFKDQTSFIYQDTQGDLLFSLKSLGVLSYLTEKSIEYVHMINPDNLLERVCEPQMAGYMYDNQMQVISKVALMKSQLAQTQKDIYLVSSNYQDILFEKWADIPPPLRQLKFMGSTMFKTSYLCKDLFQKYKNIVSKNMKCNFLKVSYYDPITSNYVFDNRPNALIIIRNQQSLIVGKKAMFWKVFALEEDANIRIDPDAPTVVSNYFKSLLGIGNSKSTDLVQISPLISYDGKEGINEIIQALKQHQTIGYPLLIQQ